MASPTASSMAGSASGAVAPGDTRLETGGVRSTRTVNGSGAAGPPLASAPLTAPAWMPSPRLADERQRLGWAPAIPGWYCDPVAGAPQPVATPSLASDTVPTPD